MTELEPTMLERAWAVLTPPRAKELVSFPLEVVCDGEPCRVALDSIGTRHLLVPVGDETISVDPKPAVLGMAVRKLRFSGPAVTYVDVSCAEPDLFPEFDEVVTDVLEAVSGAQRSASAAIGAVTRWRRLFRSRLLRGLSRQAKLGLFAELAMLSTLVEADPGFPVKVWRGPLNEPHDFEATARCLEVKGLSPGSDSIVVHGLEQLNTHDGRPLDLVILNVVEDPDGQSVSDLVDQLRSSVDSRGDLRTRLSAAGWSEQPDQPDLETFAIGEVRRLVVDIETPRIVPSSFIADSLPPRHWRPQLPDRPRDIASVEFRGLAGRDSRGGRTLSVRWWSQPFAPEGSAAAEGIVKQLGRPALDPLTVLVREAAQNSWDAHLFDGVVEFRIEVRRVGDDVEAWRELLLPGPPSEAHIDLEKALQPETVVLVVSDRNTRGLGGPLRAGERARGDETPDFVQFLRNVGEPSDHQFGGGTYGFGKGIFYRLSRIGAILVDTQTAAGGPNGRRLMGAALGHSWYLGNRRFTGRHWWGLVASDEVPDPAIAAQAEAISRALRLPGFTDGRPGTDIVILAADLGSTGSETNTHERTPQEAATYIASSLLWNLWPKMIPDERGRHMRFIVSVNGSQVPVPAPDTFNELAPFVEALRQVRDGEGVHFSRTVPPKQAGSFAMALGSADEGPTRLLVKAAKPFEGPSHHVARMRIAELVVDYLPGPIHPDPRLAYGGVFKASEDADALFASAEPPTHDDWISKGLTGSARGVVVGARTFIQKQLDERLSLGPQAGGAGGQGLGQLSALLASVVPPRFSRVQKGDGSENGSGVSGGGGFGPNGGGSRGGGVPRRGGKPRLTGTPILQVYQGRPYLVATVKVPAADATRVLSADVNVVLEGDGLEAEPPLGAVVPQIIEWRSVSGDTIVQGRKIQIPAGEESDWYVYATYVPDAVVRFRVSQVSSDGR